MGLERMGIIEQLAQVWSEEGVECREGASADVIASFEQRHGFKLSDDVRRFYMKFNGTIGTDDGLNAFWPLDEIGSVPQKLSGFSGVPDYSGIETELPNAEDYFVFADHSIWIHVFAMRLQGTSTPVIWIANGRTFGTIARSFEHFWQLYLSDPNRLIAPEPLSP